MCLNCGCGMPDDSMGNDDNITTKTLAKAAIASSMDGKSTIDELLVSLNKLKFQDLDKKIAEIKAK